VLAPNEDKGFLYKPFVTHIYIYIRVFGPQSSTPPPTFFIPTYYYVRGRVRRDDDDDDDDDNRAIIIIIIIIRVLARVCAYELMIERVVDDRKIRVSFEPARRPLFHRVVSFRSHLSSSSFRLTAARAWGPPPRRNLFRIRRVFGVTRRYPPARQGPYCYGSRDLFFFFRYPLDAPK